MDHLIRRFLVGPVLWIGLLHFLPILIRQFDVDAELIFEQLVVDGHEVRLVTPSSLFLDQVHAGVLIIANAIPIESTHWVRRLRALVFLCSQQVSHWLALGVYKDSSFVDTIVKKAKLLVPNVLLIAVVFKREEAVLVQVDGVIYLGHRVRQVHLGPVLQKAQLFAEIDSLLRIVLDIFLLHVLQQMQVRFLSNSHFGCISLVLRVEHLQI